MRTLAERGQQRREKAGDRQIEADPLCLSKTRFWCKQATIGDDGRMQVSTPVCFRKLYEDNPNMGRRSEGTDRVDD